MQEKTIETKNCKHCAFKFEVTNKDLEFYKKVSPVFSWENFQIPSPSLCPDCRNQRRLSFFNYKFLYKNNCSSCWKSTIARFSKESWIKIYCNECWWSIQKEPVEKWWEINFEESFFSQISKLIKTTPYQNLIWSLANIENNSEYTNHTSEIIDSYLVFEANTVERSFYSFALKKSNDIVDSSFVWNSQYVYECIDSYDMYNCFYCRESFWSKFSYFLDNCKNCEFCIWCNNLVWKKYHIFNKKASKQEYEELKNKLSNHSFLQEFKNDFKLKSKKYVKKYANLVWSEDSIWNNIINSKNCVNCFDMLWAEDCKYSNQINYSSDIFDVSSYGENSSLMYDSVSVWRYSNNILFTSITGKSEGLIYCIEVKKSKNCFLCVNLKDKQYCILNKQYTKEEYEELVPKIIEKMRKDWKQWEFFPSSISPFWYNETVAQEYYPIKNVKIGNGKIKNEKWVVFNWSEYELPVPKVDKIIPAEKLPENISNIPDDILAWAIECEITKKPFRIISQELDFYRKHSLGIPRKHPDQRHKERMSLRNPRKLFDRKCDTCGVDMKSTYSLEREEIVYCEDCYNKEVY